MGGMKLPRGTHYETELSCGHRLLWRERAHVPRMLEKVYCHYCCDMRKVVGIPESWQAYCQDCRFNRQYTHIETVHRHVHDHLSKCPTHTVLLYNYDKSEHYRVTTPTVNANGENELALFEFGEMK